MSASGLFIAIDGQPVDLADVSWYEKAPCGCVSGASVAFSDYGSGPARVVATAEQARDQFHETKRERDKYERLGFTFFADRLDRCVELMKPDCPHDPRYGIPPRPEVDGHSWAAVSALGSRSPLMHLVPDYAIEHARDRRYGAGDVKPLCNGKAAFWWKTEWHALDGKVECSRCVKAAVAVAR